MARPERLLDAAAIAYLLVVGAVILVLVVAGALLSRVPGARRIERAFETNLVAALDALCAPFDALPPPD